MQTKQAANSFILSDPKTFHTIDSFMELLTPHRPNSSGMYKIMNANNEVDVHLSTPSIVQSTPQGLKSTVWVTLVLYQEQLCRWKTGAMSSYLTLYLALQRKICIASKLTYSRVLKKVNCSV